MVAYRSEADLPSVLQGLKTMNSFPHELHFHDNIGNTKTLTIAWNELARELERVHPIHYAQIAAQLPGLHVVGLDTIADQAVALRLVHFVDKLYDQEVRLALGANVPLTELFAANYRHGGYEKKYRRCLSRLHELLRETEVGEGIAAEVELG